MNSQTQTGNKKKQIKIYRTIENGNMKIMKKWQTERKKQEKYFANQY